MNPDGSGIPGWLVAFLNPLIAREQLEARLYRSLRPTASAMLSEPAQRRGQSRRGESPHHLHTSYSGIAQSGLQVGLTSPAILRPGI